MKMIWKMKDIDFRENLAHSPLAALLMVSLILAVTLILLSLPVDVGVASIPNPAVGQRSSDTVYAFIDFETADQSGIQRSLIDAEKNQPMYFQCMPDASNQIALNLRHFCDEVIRRGEAEASNKEYELQNDSDSIQIQVKSVPQDQLRLLYRALNNETKLSSVLRKVEDDIISTGILPRSRRNILKSGQPVVVINNKLESDVKNQNDIASEDVAAENVVKLLLHEVPDADENIASGLKQQLIPIFQQGNLQLDIALTQQKTKAAQKKMIPLIKKYRIGELIVRKDKVLTQEDVQILTDYNLALKQYSKKKVTFRFILEKVAVCLVLMLFTCIYIFAVHPELGKDNRRIWMIGSIIIGSILCDYLAISVFRKLCAIDYLMPQMDFLAIPFAIPAILISILYGFRYAVFASIFVSGIAALFLNSSFPVFITGMLVSTICGYTAKNISDYKNVFLVPLRYCTLSTFALGLLFMIHTMNPEILGDNVPNLVFHFAILSLGTSVITSILTVTTLLILESTLDLSTELFFMSYINRNHPLLKEFQMNAPGSYHHCERVASIAENAAWIIGAPPAMVQACALFHDVGKMLQPGMFTENSDGTDQHMKLTPKESAAVIRQHVIYGLELARKYKLKRRICDAIREHHGTDFISFFYMQAKKEDPDVKEEDFRYAGPAPQSKLTALLMLADCAEAISMSMVHPTREALNAKLKECFLRKMENGQLDEAPITTAEINQIRESLVASLSAMGHVRIAYPPMAPKEDPAK